MTLTKLTIPSRPLLARNCAQAGGMPVERSGVVGIVGGVVVGGGGVGSSSYGTALTIDRCGVPPATELVTVPLAESPPPPPEEAGRNDSRMRARSAELNDAAELTLLKPKSAPLSKLFEFGRKAGDKEEEDEEEIRRELPRGCDRVCDWARMLLTCDVFISNFSSEGLRVYGRQQK